MTIDDGYSARNEVLDMLIAKNVRGTLFVIGSVARSDPAFVRRACDAGFEFGSHTYSHADLTKLSPSDASNEVKRDVDTLVAIDERAKPLPYLRPFGGNRNSSTDQIGANLGERTILWNVSGDAGNYTVDGLVKLYLSQIDAFKNPWGSIILMHFNQKTPQALAQIIDGIRGRGMEPVPLSKLFEGGRT